jgi:cytochrome P450
MRFTPPKPAGRKKMALLGGLFSRDGRSVLDLVPEKAYQVQMSVTRFAKFALFLVNAPQTIRQVMVDQTPDYPKHDLLVKTLEPLLGLGIFNSNGSDWEKQRRLVDQAFVLAGLRRAFPLMATACADMIRRCDAIADGRDWDAESEMSHVTADIIFRTVLSKSLDVVRAKQVQTDFSAYQDAAQRYGGLDMLHLPTFYHRWRCHQLGAAIRQPYADVIRARYQALERGDKDLPEDMLSTLIHARDPATGEGFSESEVVDQIGLLFLAGHETSATTLAWALYLLARQPDIQDEVRTEVLKVWGDRDPEYGDTRALSLTHDVFRETLRLYPPIPFYPRQAAKSGCLRDKQVNEGQMVLVSPWIVQRHRELWNTPDEFDPGRFCTETGKASAKTAYLPFGLGPRACPGSAFATQEGLLILALLIRRYRVEIVDGHVPRPSARITLRSFNGVKLRLTRLRN